MSDLRDKVIEERRLLENPSYDLVELTVQSPPRGDASPVSRSKGAVRHRGGVVILPLLEQPGRSPRVVMVENERIVLGQRLVELPAGGLKPGEAPEAAAARELREETGYEAAVIEPLARFYTAPGFCDEAIHAFVATGLHEVGQDLEDDEALVTKVLSITEIEAMLDGDSPLDAKTVTVLALAQRKHWLSF